MMNLLDTIPEMHLVGTAMGALGVEGKTSSS